MTNSSGIDLICFKNFPIATTPPITSTNNNEVVVLSTFPNPASRTISIDIPSNLNAGKVQIINTLGQLMLIRSTEPGQRLNVDIQSLQLGMYYIKIEVDQRVYTSKFIKRGH